METHSENANRGRSGREGGGLPARGRAEVAYVPRRPPLLRAAPDPRGVLDRWIALMLDELDLPYISPIQAGMEYLAKYVVSSVELGKLEKKTALRAEKIDFSPTELIWIFLALRDGQQPRPADVKKILFMDKSLPENLSEDISALLTVRWS